MAAVATMNGQHDDDSSAHMNGDSSKLPSSITRVYNVPIVKDSINYADSVLKSYSLSAAAYSTAENLAASVYKRAGEPIQDRLQPQINQLDGLANRGLDYVQGKAPYIFEAKPDELVATARKPADQAYTTAKAYQDSAYSTAKGYQGALSSRLHETLVQSHAVIDSLQTRLAKAVAVVPRSGEEAQNVANSLLEHLENARAALVKQSHDLPAHVSKAVQPYAEKLQQAATDVKTELGKKDVPIHVKAQHIIGITKDITAESVHDAVESLRVYVSQSKGKIEDASEKANAGEEKEQVKENGQHAVESTEQFVEEHTPGNISYAEAVKE